MAELINTLSYVTSAYPISAINLTSVQVMAFSGNLSDPTGGGCGLGWNKLLNQIGGLKGQGSKDVVVGLLPAGVPNNGFIGCGGGSSGSAAGYVNDGQTLAQEIGHVLNRRHGPCGAVQNVDTNYPVYENAPSGTIGEFGFNTRTNQVFDPGSARDFMTYCGPKWVSPYTYVGLMGTITNAFMSAVGPSQRQDTRHLADPHQDPDGPELLIRESIPWYPETRAIAFRRDQEVLYRRELEGPPPEVSIAVPAGLVDRRGTMRLEWKPVRKSAPVKYLVRFSHDGGGTWQTIAADLGDPWAAIQLDLLPGGEDCRFQIAASSGIRTTVSESAPFALPMKAVQAYLLEPVPDAVFLEGESIVFRGDGFSPNFETTPFEDVLWSSRIDGLIGVGPECVVSTLTAGRHRITVSMPDGLGGESTAGVTIDVRAKR